VRGKFLLLNDDFVEVTQWDETLIQGIVVYEVLRIIDGVPLFFEDHFLRLLKSCELSGKEINVYKNRLFHQFVELGKKNNISEGNIILKYIFNKEEYSQLFFFIPHSYPSDEDYRNGVKVGFIEIERNNPEAKVDQGVKEKVIQSGQAPDVYEVMLVDKDGFITEGSRSNMVFVKGNALYTCLLNRVLKGITLTKVIEIASTENIPVVFEQVHQSNISSFNALFITGTSPKILPVFKAGNTTFDTDNQLMRKFMKLYNNLMEEEMKNTKVYYKTSKSGEN
jgi:branched-chain amino acid aminotransferase